MKIFSCFRNMEADILCHPVRDDPPPYSLESAKLLYAALWNKGDSLRSLLLRPATFDSEGSGSDHPQPAWLELSAALLPPCGIPKIFYRPIYQTFWSSLRKLEEDAGYWCDPGTELVKNTGRSRRHEDQAVFISADQGLGKTVILSLLLIERLLAGMPTIICLSDGARDAADYVHVPYPETDDLSAYIVFCAEGVYRLSDLEENSQLKYTLMRDQRVWVLFENHPRPLPRF